jgi:Flp pilus assembly protein TadD
MTRIARPLLRIVVALALSAATSCGSAQDDQRTDSLDPEAARETREAMAPEAVAQLDSGNAAFRADDFGAARRHFRSVVEIAPKVAAGWFGLYLAERALGNVEEAERALERARQTAPGASLIRQDEEGSR